MRALKLAAVALVALALSGAVATAANAPATGSREKSRAKEVTVADFFFSPEMVAIHKGQSVKWVWAEGNTYPHDVHLKKGPKGLKERSSYSTKTTAVTDATFEKKFTTPGTYKYICTIHPSMMHMTVVVKK